MSKTQYSSPYQLRLTEQERHALILEVMRGIVATSHGDAPEAGRDDHLRHLRNLLEKLSG